MQPNLQQRRLLGDTSSSNCSTYISHFGNSLKVLRRKHVLIWKESPLSYVPSSSPFFSRVSSTFLVLTLESHNGSRGLTFQGFLWGLLFLYFALSVSSPDTEFCLSFLSFFPFNSCSVSPSLCLIESASLLYVTCDPKHLLVHTIYVTMPHKVISPDFSKDSTTFSSYSLGSPCKSLVKITALDFWHLKYV